MQKNDEGSHNPPARCCPRGFVEAMRAFFAEKDSHQARRAQPISVACSAIISRRAKRKLGLSDVNEMFRHMRDTVK